MIDRKLYSKHLSSIPLFRPPETGLDRAVEFFKTSGVLAPLSRYRHAVSGTTKRGIARDCEDGMRHLERAQ